MTKTIALARAVTFGSLVIFASVARADQIVNIYDLTVGVPTATIDGNPVAPLPDSTSEYLHFQYTPESAWQWADHISNYMWSRDLYEPNSTVLSDRLLLTYNFPTLGNVIDVQFDSRDTILIPQGNFNGFVFSPKQETGSLQLLIGLVGQNSIQYFYAASPVPEPSAVALAAMGAIGILGVVRRHRRQA